jgi:hypothetical protein
MFELGNPPLFYVQPEHVAAFDTEDNGDIQIRSNSYYTFAPTNQQIFVGTDSVPFAAWTDREGSNGCIRFELDNELEPSCVEFGANENWIDSASPAGLSGIVQLYASGPASNSSNTWRIFQGPSPLVEVVQVARVNPPINPVLVYSSQVSGSTSFVGRSSTQGDLIFIFYVVDSQAALEKRKRAKKAQQTGCVYNKPCTSWCCIATPFTTCTATQCPSQTTCAFDSSSDGYDCQ